MSIYPDNPNSAVLSSKRCFSFERGNWKARTDATITIAAERDLWTLTGNLQASDADGVIFEKTWNEKIERDLI